MITERMIKRLDNIVAKYAYRDYRAACMKQRGRITSYTLSEATNEAREMRNLAMKRDTVTLEDEKHIKLYLTRKLMIGEMDGILESEKGGNKYDPARDYNSI